jgi:hypothetical protein
MAWSTNLMIVLKEKPRGLWSRSFGPQEQPQAGEKTGRQSLQVLHDRFYRCHGAPRDLCHHWTAHDCGFFCGWDFDAKDANSRMPARAGCTKGVPMGSDLAKSPKGKVPTFLVAALKNPVGANLDCYRIVKGWMDEYDRRDRTDLGVEGPGFQPGTTYFLLRSRHRDSDATMDSL